MQESRRITVVIESPLVTAKRFAEIYGKTERAVTDMVTDGKLPVMPKTEGQRESIINMVEFASYALDAIDGAPEEWFSWRDRIGGIPRGGKA